MKLPVIGAITSPFGERTHPLTKKKSLHNGIDIAVPEGTHVISPLPGVVKTINSHASGGNQLIIEHDNGWLTGYAHLLDNRILKVGDRVEAGQLVALSGNTGQSTGAHLHFTLTIDGKKVNPLDYFTV